MRPSLRQVLFRSAAGLDLNFAGGAFSLNNTRSASPADIPGWSFSRTDTNGTATALDLAGNVIQFPSRTNLLTYSQQFDDAAWSKARASVTADTTVAPDGTTTADSLVEDTTNNSHPVYRTVASLANATAYTWSIFVAPLGRTSCNLAASNTAFGTPGNATFSLTGAGSVTASSGCTAAIQAVAGGFYRCSITLTTVASGNGDIYIQPFNAATSYLGNGLPALAIWGAQLETGSTATAYIPTTTAAVTVALPRITNRGILVEEARTNLCIADWQAPGVGVSITSTTITNPVGGTTAIRVTGLLAAAGDRAGSSVALVSVGVQYAGAVFIKGTAGEKISVYAKRLNGTSATSATVQVTFTGLWQRVENLVMTTATGNTGIIVWINNNGTTDTANTVDLWNAQVEAGAFSTSPIITTGAAGTRGADVALVDSLTSITYPLTMVGEWSREGGTDATTFYRVASLSRVADDSDSEIYQRHTNNVVRAFQRTLGAGQADVTLGTGSIGDVQRAAARFATNDVTGSFNGAAVVSDTVVTMPASPPLSFAVGSTNGISRWLNGYIRRVQVLPYAVTDAQLQALTAP